MGSFNETCAISGLSIECGDPVKLVFLVSSTRCESGEYYYKRGCYHYDHWFLRTPPISGKYDDYGRCAFKESFLTKLIEEMFALDVIEEPFGHNSCHAVPVPNKPNMSQLLDAAWEGRLRVRDTYFSTPKVADHIPTWQKVKEILQQADFKIMEKRNDAAYNAQPVRDGVVYVHFNSYENTTKKIQKVNKLLSEQYDCRIVYEHGNKEGECGLIVSVKGAFADNTLLSNLSLPRIKVDLEESPKNLSVRPYKLPVVAVMIREDVWNLYRDTPWSVSWRNEDRSAAGFKQQISNIMNNKMEEDDLMSGYRLREKIRETFVYLPLVTSLGDHLSHLLENKKLGKNQREEAIKVFAEAARVEATMSQLSQAWQVPILAGQEPEWELHQQINTGLRSIIDSTIERYKEESEWLESDE